MEMEMDGSGDGDDGDATADDCHTATAHTSRYKAIQLIGSDRPELCRTVA